MSSTWNKLHPGPSKSELQARIASEQEDNASLTNKLKTAEDTITRLQKTLESTQAEAAQHHGHLQYLLTQFDDKIASEAIKLSSLAGRCRVASLRTHSAYALQSQEARNLDSLVANEYAMDPSVVLNAERAVRQVLTKAYAAATLDSVPPIADPHLQLSIDHSIADNPDLTCESPVTITVVCTATGREGEPPSTIFSVDAVKTRLDQLSSAFAQAGLDEKGRFGRLLNDATDLLTRDFASEVGRLKVISLGKMPGWSRSLSHSVKETYENDPSVNSTLRPHALKALSRWSADICASKYSDARKIWDHLIVSTKVGCNGEHRGEWDEQTVIAISCQDEDELVSVEDVEVSDSTVSRAFTSMGLDNRGCYERP